MCGCHVRGFVPATWLSIAKENNTTINLGEAVVKWRQRLSDATLKILSKVLQSAVLCGILKIVVWRVWQWWQCCWCIAMRQGNCCYVLCMAAPLPSKGRKLVPEVVWHGGAMLLVSCRKMLVLEPTFLENNQPVGCVQKIKKSMGGDGIVTVTATSPGIWRRTSKRCW